jgi:hypothetical protein
MATTTDMPTTTKPSPAVKTPATYQRSIPAARLRGIPAARLGMVVDRTTELSDEVLTSVEEGQRAAIESLGRFVITLEEALPQEVEGTSKVAKTVTGSGLEMADRLVHTQYDFLRRVIGSTGKSLRRNGAKPGAAK